MAFSLVLFSFVFMSNSACVLDCMCIACCSSLNWRSLLSILRFSDWSSSISLPNTSKLPPSLASPSASSWKIFKTSWLQFVTFYPFKCPRGTLSCILGHDQISPHFSRSWDHAVATWIKQFTLTKEGSALNWICNLLFLPVESPFTPVYPLHLSFCVIITVFFVLLSLLLLLPFFSRWVCSTLPLTARHNPMRYKKAPNMALLNCDHLWRLPIRTIPTALRSSPLSDLSLFAEVLILLNSWPICFNFRWFSPCEEPRRKQLHHYMQAKAHINVNAISQNDFPTI